MKDLNNFGPMSAEYNSARRGYPNEVFEHLHSLTKKEKSLTLDIGCGTGISTRQLKEHNFEVVGADKDPEMIAVAERQTTNISYIVAPASKLPFQSNYFDVVTAFTAFHWFNNEKSLSEIKRVLKPGGIFFAALKTNRKDRDEDFIKGYFSILKKYAGDNFDPTGNHFIKEFLMKVGFLNITERSFYDDEKYTIEQALVFIQSLSLWNCVADDKKIELLKEMREFYENHLVNGFVVRSREIATIVAFKE